MTEADKVANLNGIRVEACKDRQLYRLDSRNLTLGVFRGASGGFFGIRRKLGSTFVFEEYHWDTGAPFGTVVPLEELVDILPPKIESVASFPDAECSLCGQVCFWEVDGPGLYVGKWFHREDKSPLCDKGIPNSRENVALFTWLSEMEAKYESDAERPVWKGFNRPGSKAAERQAELDVKTTET